LRIKSRGLIYQTRNKDGSDKSDPYKKKNADFKKENIKIELKRWSIKNNDYVLIS